MDNFRKQAMPKSARERAVLQTAMYFARKRNRAARAPASPVGQDRERLSVDNDIDSTIDNPDNGA